MDRNKKLGILAAIVLVLVVLGLSIGYAFHWRYFETTDNAYVQADISVVSAKITGYVQEISVQDNQMVKEGDILVTVLPIEYQARLDKAKSDLNLALASVSNVTARLNLQGSSILEVQADMEKIKADIDLFKKSYDRALSLNRNDFASKKMLETAEADYLKAQASLKKAQATLQATKQQLLVLQTEKEQSEAKRKGAEADLALAQQDFDNTKVTTPITGSVGNKLVQQGQLVRPGQYLMSVVPQTCYVFANFKETQLEKMTARLKVTMTVDTFPDKVFSGTVESLSPASGSVFSLLPPENATGNFTKIVQRIPVKITFDRSEDARMVRAGMSVVVKVDTRKSASP